MEKNTFPHLLCWLSQRSDYVDNGLQLAIFQLFFKILLFLSGVVDATVWRDSAALFSPGNYFQLTSKSSTLPLSLIHQIHLVCVDTQSSVQDMQCMLINQIVVYPAIQHTSAYWLLSSATLTIVINSQWINLLLNHGGRWPWWGIWPQSEVLIVQLLCSPGSIWTQAEIITL